MSLLCNCSPGEIRVAAVQGGGLIDYAIWRPGRPDGVGDVHRGRVSATVPAMAGAFISLSGGEEGFLPDTAGATGHGVGDWLAVRVLRAAQGGKGPRLQALPEPPGNGAPALLRPGPNPVERLAALHPGPVVVDDPGIAATLRGSLRDRVATGQAWTESLAAAVEALASPMAAMPGGLRASFEPTAALVAIDLDAASATGARELKANAQETANRAALPALARQIRLRNLAGLILVDLAGMTVQRRTVLAEPFRAALAPDPARPRLLGFTVGGLAEIQRPRIHPPLHELLAGPHAAGLAALRLIASRPAPGAPAQGAPVLWAAPDVVSALHADPAALTGLAHRLGHPLLLRSDPALPPCHWRVEETRSA